MSDTPVQSGYAELPSGVRMYHESRGTGDVPLIAVHGGFGMTTMFGPLLDTLATDRQVIAVELQGHGHTGDIDRPFSLDAFGDDLADLIGALGFDRADLLGYSLGGLASLRAAIRHPDRVRRLITISIPFRRNGSYPEVLQGMDTVSSAGFEHFTQAPIYTEYVAVAPDPDAFVTLMDKTGELLRQDYDWADEVRELSQPTLIICGDADSFPPAHAAEFHALLGGGQRDPGVFAPDIGSARLAILPGATHYSILEHPLLPAVLAGFLTD